MSINIKQVALVVVGGLVLWQVVAMLGKKTSKAAPSTFKDMGNGVTVDDRGQWWQGGQIIYAPKQEWLA